MLIRKEVIDAIGGFDRDYFTSHGEVDFCIRAKKNGFKVLYCPDVSVKHRVEKGGTNTPERRYYLFRNKLIFIKKNAPIPLKWIALVLYFFFWPPKILFDLLRRNELSDLRSVKMIFKGVWDGWLNRVGKRV